MMMMMMMVVNGVATPAEGTLLLYIYLFMSGPALLATSEVDYGRGRDGTCDPQNVSPARFSISCCVQCAYLLLTPSIAKTALLCRSKTNRREHQRALSTEIVQANLQILSTSRPQRL